MVPLADLSVQQTNRSTLMLFTRFSTELTNNNSFNGCKKGMSTILSFMIVVALVAIGIGIVTSTGNPIVESLTADAQIRIADDVVKSIDNAVMDVVRDGKGGARVITFTAPKEFEVIPEEDAVQFRVETASGLQDYLSRTQERNKVTIAGGDVNCFERDENGDGSTDLVVENTYIKGVFRRTPKTAPLSSINTTESIILLNEKTGGTNITFSNTSVLIDGIAGSERGTGYSEISRTGSALPACRVHFFVNATAVRYDVYYKLYAGADFFVAEVDNII